MAISETPLGLVLKSREELPWYDLESGLSIVWQLTKNIAVESLN